MNVLVACEFSGVVREAFRTRGHNAWSCDLLPSEDESPYHMKGDVRKLFSGPLNNSASWDLMIAHPPCTYLNSAGLHWNERGRGHEKTAEALEFVRELMAAPIERICIENPVGCIGTKIRPADQYVQPYDFGHNASKKTGLWLKRLPRLVSWERIAGRLVMRPDGRSVERWANQTDSGQNRLAPSADRWALRSITYPGIAKGDARTMGNSMKLRPANSYKVRACEKAESLLRAALMCASVADCPKLQGKIRCAIASARGAVSHVRVRLVRTRPTYGVLHVDKY